MTRLLRWTAAAAALTVTIAHLPPAPSHLEEVGYVGIGFLILAAACLTAAIILVLGPLASARSAAWTMAAFVSAAAIIALTLSRTVGLPAMHDDIGHWTEPFAVASVTAEAVLVATAGGKWFAVRLAEARAGAGRRAS